MTNFKAQISKEIQSSKFKVRNLDLDIDLVFGLGYLDFKTYRNAR